MCKLEVGNKYAIIGNSFANSNAIVANTIENYCNSNI
jgi:hypothetical protein